MVEKDSDQYRNLDISEDNLDGELNDHLYRPFSALKKRLPDLAVPGTEIVDDMGILEKTKIKGYHFEDDYLSLDDEDSE